MTRTFICYLLICCLGLLGLQHSKANIIAYEGFDIPVGDFNGLAGATSFGWSAPWAASPSTGFATASIASPGLTYTDGNSENLPQIGEFANTNIGFGGAAGFSRTLGTTLNSGTVWMSFLLSGSNFSGGTANINFDSGGGGTNLTLNFDNTGAYSLSASGSTSGTVAPVGILSDFLVMRIDFTGATGNVYLFENPSLGTANEPTLGSASASLLGVNASDLIVNQFSASVLIMAGTYINADELRIGTLYNDVAPVPEPTTNVLSLIGLAFILLRSGWRQKTKVAY